MSLIQSTPAPPVTTPQHPPKPYLTIRPRAGWAALDLPELWRFRDLLMQLALRDLKLRYKQTLLGVIWVVLQPLLAAGIFSFVFGLVAGLDAPGETPYFLFAFAGLLGWNLFANTLGRVSTCLVGNSHLISKVYFPRLILPFSTAPSVLVDFGVALAMCVVLKFIFATPWTPAILLLPVWIATLITLAMGIGLLTSALSVSYRDVNYILPVFLQMLLYASPVAYAVSAVPEHLQKWYYLNPMAGIIEAFRWSLIGGTAPHPIALSVTFLAGLLVCALGLWTFRQTERRFADIV